MSDYNSSCTISENPIIQPAISTYFISKRGKLFQSYDHYVQDKLVKLPRWQRPLYSFKDDVERALERYLEAKYSLPPKHLRGLIYKKPPGVSPKRYAKIVAADLQRQELIIAIKETINEEFLGHKQSILQFMEQKYSDTNYTMNINQAVYERGIAAGLAHKACLSSNKLSDIYNDLNHKMELIAELLMSKSDEKQV